jgi:glycosyltransferase involved in cell wall biosynthesis
MVIGQPRKLLFQFLQTRPSADTSQACKLRAGLASEMPKTNVAYKWRRSGVFRNLSGRGARLACPGPSLGLRLGLRPFVLVSTTLTSVWVDIHLRDGKSPHISLQSAHLMIWQLIDSSTVGGAERHVATLADGLRSSGCPVEVVLLAQHGRNPWLDQLDDARLPYRHLDGSFGGLRRALATERPKLLHTHGYKAGILGRLAARAAGVLVVSTFHSGERGAFPVGAYEFLDDWTSLLGGRIAVSETIARRLPFKSAVVPSFVQTAPSAPTAPLPKLAAFVGRLSAEKGPEMFCRLAAHDVASGPDAIAWHVWGDGPLRAELEARYGQHVTFHGIATRMDDVWPKVGLLVMPSQFEGVPLAALEAAARGIPVLASRVGGLPTVVRHGVTGWLFEPGNLTAAGAGLNAWRDAVSHDATALRHACWSKARDDFSQTRWLPDVLAVYRSTGLRVPSV